MRVGRMGVGVLAVAVGAIAAPAGAEEAPLAAAAAAGPQHPGAAVSARGEFLFSLAPLVGRAMPAVVRIYSRSVIRRTLTSQLLEEPIMQRFFGDMAPQVAGGERVLEALGSGVMVRGDGTIVTVHHVVEGARDIMVILSDHREFPARVLVDDPQTDLAVLKLEAFGEEMPHVPIADLADLRIGDVVVAIGNPFGVGQTATAGIVSALARTTVGTTDFRYYIQTDAAINPGNSGGPLIDVDGRLVGINASIYAAEAGGSVGIGFAVPANMVRAVVNAAISGKPLVRPWLGASGLDLPVQMADSLGMDSPAGAFIHHVHPEGPYAAAGGRPGDVVLAIDGREVEDAEALRFRLATREAGTTVRLTLRRGWFMGEIEVTLVAPPETPPPEERRLRGYHPLSGARVANLSPALAEKLAVDSAIEGVVVLGTSPGSAAAQRGVRRGDIIFEIDGEPVARVADLAPFIRRPYPGWKVGLQRGEARGLIEMSMVKL